MRSPQKILIKLAVLLLLSGKLYPQSLFYNEDGGYGLNLGLNLAFGTHIQRLGLNLNFFYIHDHIQANSELRAYFSFKNLGPKFRYPELVLSQGVLYAYGNEKEFLSPFFNPVSNQTLYSNSVGYAYNAYFNTRKTMQQTGTIAFQFNNISVIAENDILGHTFYDRFRTGGFLIQCQYRDQFMAGINCSLWTGQMGKAIRNDTSVKHCYMDTVGGRYTQYSHGLLSAQFKYYAGYEQNVQANIGIDAEQVRNAVQNKLIHDLVFIPRKWIKTKNCHIPMLDDQGGPYLGKEGQKIKKPELYLNAYSNASLFY